MVTEQVDVEVKAGQVWEDMDPRKSGRAIEVTEVFQNPAGGVEPYAVCTLLTPAYNVSESAVGRMTRVKLRRFRDGLRGYRLRQVFPES